MYVFHSGRREVREDFVRSSVPAVALDHLDNRTIGSLLGRFGRPRRRGAPLAIAHRGVTGSWLRSAGTESLSPFERISFKS
jgi:hypothetical protein